MDMVELKKYFDYILNNYLLPENGGFSSQMEYYKVIVNKIPEEISKIIDNQKYKIYGSCGKGAKSASPYIAICDRTITTSTQKGIYVDFIFKSDMSGFYLTIDQGITNIKERYGNKVAKEKAKQAAELFRSMISDLKGFESGLVSDHTKSGSLEEGYENTRVIAKYYNANSYSNDVVIEDLKNIMNIYEEIIGRLSGKSYDEIIEELDDSNSYNQNDSVQYWTYSPGENASQWEYCIKNNKMVIGFDEIGDLKAYSSREELKNKLSEIYEKENQPNNTSACDDFVNKINIGDIIIAKIGQKQLLGYGIVTGDYYYDNNRDQYRHTRNVEWKKIGRWDIPDELRVARKTLTDITSDVDFAQKLLKIIEGEQIMPTGVEWIIPANKESYNHEEAFNKFGFIDWSQTRNVDVGDLIYIYLGSPEKRLFAMGIVEKININSNDKIDDSAFWNTPPAEQAKKYFRIKLIKFLDDKRLSLLELEKHGLVGAPMGGQRVNKQLSEYINSVVNNSIDNSIEEFKEYYLININDFKKDQNQTESIKRREEFKEEYPISRIRKLSIDEYALGTTNFKETLSYYLEFGKYRYAGPGIGGATSAKHGFYKRDDGHYYGMKNKQIDNPTEYWEAFKNQLADFYEEYGKSDIPLRASSKYPLLQGMSMVLTKILYVYYPMKFVNVCSKQKLRELLNYFNYEFDNNMQAEELSFILNKRIREDIPELADNDPQYVGAILWKFINELESQSEEGDEEVENDIVDIDSNRITGAYNKIVYGVPGCGKSYYVSNTIVDKDTNKGSVFRTTFYPDYTNGDFVGQVIPKLNSKDETTVLYDIQSGPFTDALLDAILNPNKNTYLIIEEINRGNAAAIFGDIFQLLDRTLEGYSEYPIKNYIISTFLHKKIDNKYSVYYDLDNIKIPSNLIIIGTMNTSDQNVFTLDTAFKRRWKMEYIQNNINECIYADYKVPMSDITWAEFVKEINDFITSDSGLDINGEDKQIGSYFVTGSEWNDIKTTADSKEAARIFAEKVLSYIWEDVAKINRDAWFESSKYRTLDSLVTAYMEKGLEVFSDNISFTRETDKD